LIENFTLGGGAQALVITSAQFVVEDMGDLVAILLAVDTPEALEGGVHVPLVLVLLTGIPKIIPIPIPIPILDQDLILDLRQDPDPDPDLGQDHRHHPAVRHGHHLINAATLTTTPLHHTVPLRGDLC